MMNAKRVRILGVSTLEPSPLFPGVPTIAQSGAPGYESVATCLASPDVRARTEGVVAMRPPAA